VQRYLEPEAAPLTFRSRYVEEEPEGWRGGEAGVAEEGMETFEGEVEEEAPEEEPPPSDLDSDAGMRLEGGVS
jgi:hypothetical protein